MSNLSFSDAVVKIQKLRADASVAARQSGDRDFGIEVGTFDDVLAILSGVVDPGLKDQWLPIETAPKDTEVFIGRWEGSTFEWGRSIQFYEDANEFEGETFSGWLWASDDCGDSVADDPQLWRPLVALPSRPEEDSDE